MMKIARIVLIIFILLISSFSLLIMNSKFDRLSRYPYEIKQSTHDKINYYLNDDEINYIIEWSIAPSEFVSYLENEYFNIFHLEKYKLFSEKLKYLSYDEVIKFYEEIKIYNEQEILEYLNYYNHEELLFWYQKGDYYNVNSVLVKNPYAFNLVLDKDNSIGIKSFNNLKTIDFIENKEVLLRDKLVESLAGYCDKNLDNCKEIIITQGYLNYNQLLASYKENGDEIPGHSIFQTGLAFKVDFNDVQTKEYFDKNSKEYNIFKISDNTYRFFIGEEKEVR